MTTPSGDIAPGTPDRPVYPVLALVLGLAGIAAGTLGLLPAPLAAVVAVGVSSACYGWLLLRRLPPPARLLAGAVRGAPLPARESAPPDGASDAAPPAAGRGTDPCSPAGFLGIGVAIGAVSTVGAGLAAWLAPLAMAGDVPLAAEIPLVGLFFTAGMYLLGLLLMPGAAATFVGRLRRCLDAIGVGVAGFLVAWLLLFDRHEHRGAALSGILLACIAVAVMIVAGLRTVRHQPLALLCAAGPILSTAGQAGLTVVLDYAAWPGWLLVSAALLVVGPALTWYGVRATERAYDGPPAARPDSGYAGYPWLALPLGAALLAVGYHLLQREPFDSVALVLIIAGVAVVAVREALATMDVRRYAADLELREARFRSMVAGSTDVTVVLDRSLVVRWQSPAAAREFGLSDQEVVGRPVLGLVHPDDAARVAQKLRAAILRTIAEHPHPGGELIEARIRDGFGAWRETEWSVADQRGSPDVGSLVLHVRDVGERNELARTLQRTAGVDPLTGLPDRGELTRVAGRADPGVLMVIALGGVGGVNEARGRDVGDAVLVEAARRLRAGSAAPDTLSRLGGDRFAVVTHGGAVQAQLLATRLVTMLTEPYQVAAVTVYVSASAGLAELADGVDGDEALRRAELAVRGAGRGAVEWYDMSLEAGLHRRLAVEQALAGVVGRGELALVYQPVVDLTQRRVVGAEALLRWTHPELGEVPPAEFVPVADELGVLDPIAEWALQAACRQLSLWVRAKHDLWVSVNALATQVARPAFPATVEAALSAYQVAPARLVVEVAEDGLYPPVRAGRVDPAADVTAQRVTARLAELRGLGVRIAVDHFGSTAASLGRLRVLPVDLLKVDRHLFTEPAGQAGPAAAIVDVVVKLGAQIGVDVVAQQLESAADLDAAAAAGCAYGQGFVLGRPVPAAELTARLPAARSGRSG